MCFLFLNGFQNGVFSKIHDWWPTAGDLLRQFSSLSPIRASMVVSASHDISIKLCDCFSTLSVLVSQCSSPNENFCVVRIGMGVV